jgi:membrane associated rhomboid family serine protease
MFFPIRTDRRLRRTPWVNYALIALNVGVYAFTWQSTQQYAVDSQGGYSIQESFQNSPGVSLWLWPNDPNQTHIRLYQFLTYQFVHSGPEPIPFFGLLLPLHLIFNMLFLYVFGNAVEDRMGKLGYLGFYLAGGVLAGLAHITLGVSPGPVLGASGAVAGVTGAYLALFPLSNVTIAYWLVVFVGSFVVSSMVLILFRVAMDVLFQFGNVGNTAYVAHLAGYVYGFVVGILLLLTRLLPRENYDMLALIEQQRRRRQFRKLSKQGFEPWDHASRPGDPPKAGAVAGPSADEQRLMQRRGEVQRAIGASDLPRAAELYEQLLAEHPDQTLPQQTQLDLATQLAADQRYHVAAQAYELFLRRFRDYPQRSQVQLILGLIYVNYLDQNDRGRELLTEVRPKLEASQQTLADRALARSGT